VTAPQRPAGRPPSPRATTDRTPTLVVLTRFPLPGHVKTRLIPALGARRAAALHRALARRTIAAAREARALCGCAIEVHHDGGTPAALARWLGADVAFVPQGAGDLGRRLASAVRSARARRRGPVVLVGTDCPALEGRHVAAACAALQRCDVALGPALDGGYWLLGLARPAAALFRRIPWGTDRVLARTRAAARTAGQTVALLERLADVDRPEDLRFLPAGFAEFRR
jgi:uncharacterized protein